MKYKPIISELYCKDPYEPTTIMECHKRGFCCRCSQGTQLDPSLLVNEGSQAEQIEAGDVFWKQHLFSAMPFPCQRASGWTMLNPMFLIGCLKTTFGCRKWWKFSTSHWSTKISQAFRGSFPLGQNQRDLVVCFCSGLYWSSGYQRCCFTTSLEISNENSGDLAMEWDRPEISWAFPWPSQSTKESFKRCEMKVVNVWPFFDKYSVFLFLANTASPWCRRVLG